MCNKVKRIYIGRETRELTYQYCVLRPNDLVFEVLDASHEKLAATVPRNAVAICGLRPQLFKDLTYNATISKN
jgi:hypothetical protein